MAKLEILSPYILSWEGGFAKLKGDRGGATNKGVTLSVWKKQGYDKNGDGDIDIADLKLITNVDAVKIMRENYWNRWKANNIKDQSLANLLVDWVWGSGAWGIKLPQQILGVNADGIVGNATLSALNSANAKVLFYKIWQRRKKYLISICNSRPANSRFLKGWLRRLQGIQFGYLKYANNKTIKF